MCAQEYQTVELMASATSKLVEDGTTVLTGTGMPIIAMALAIRTHAPNVTLIFEAGGIAPRIPVLPVSVGDSRTFYKAVMATSLDYVMSTAQQGFIDCGMLGAAQIDMYGNINTTVIGSFEKPKARLPGSGGGNDVGSLCWKTIVIMQHDPRRFVKKLDFLTTPGYLEGPGSREEAGLPEGTGPYRVVTQLGIMGFDEATKRMMLLSVHPGVSVDDVKAATGFELIIPPKVTVTDPPTPDEIRILRQDIDPAGIIIKKEQGQSNSR
jgi:acyl CoA:acetate/3-ketoacid CoA transferase beta subunit